MNNNRNMMTTLLTIGAAGAAIYGITRGIQNGTFQRLPQTLSNAMNHPTVQQITKPLQNMANNQGVQEITNTLAGTTDSSQQGTTNPNTFS